MMKTFRRILLIVFAALAFVGGGDLSRADDLAGLFEQAKSAAETDRLDEAGDLLEKANALAVKNGKTEEILLAELNLAQWCILSKWTNSSIGHIESATRRVRASSLARLERGIVLNSLGTLNFRLRRFEPAVRELAEALDLLGREMGFYHPQISFVQGSLGSAQLAAGDEKEAAKNLREAATNLQQMHVASWTGLFVFVFKAQVEDYHVIVGYLSDYANLLRRQDKRRYESKRLEELHELQTRMFGKNNVSLVPVLWRSAYNAEDRGYESSAKKHFLKAVEIADTHRDVLDLRLSSRQHLSAFHDRQKEPKLRDAVNREIAGLGGRTDNLAETVEEQRGKLFEYTFNR
jgi:hypothetical protein